MNAAHTGMGDELTVGKVGLHVARTRPGKLAVYDDRRRLTYGELDRQVQALAGSLVAEGVAKGGIVCAYLPNCIDYIVLVLAVARAGAVFSPLNPRFKAYEIAKLLAKARPAMVFTTHDRVATVMEALGTPDRDGPPPRIVSIDGGDAPPAPAVGIGRLRPPAPSLPAVAETDLFSLMFTSGTTGHPKGALAAHRARMIWVVNAAIQYGLNEDDVYLGTMPQVHSAGLTFTLIHLYIGATVRVMEHFDPDAYLEIVERERITSSLTVPTMLNMILEARRHSARRHDLGSLRCVLTCGSPLPLSTKQQVLNEISDRLYDYYGSTESNSMSVLKPRDQLRKPASVGQPFVNVEFTIAGPDGQALPAGETGEIWCANPSVMDRYLGSEADTAAAFSGRWYRTGDLGYLDEEGFLYIVGRSKDMFVSGGVNVYPAEIEQVIMLHPAVLDCAVIGVDDEKWGQVAKVFVTLRKGHGLTLEALQAHCRQYLADYKKPRYLQFMAEIPKNAGGKTIKAALPAGIPETEKEAQQ